MLLHSFVICLVSLACVDQSENFSQRLISIFPLLSVTATERRGIVTSLYLYWRGHTSLIIHKIYGGSLSSLHWRVRARTNHNFTGNAQNGTSCIFSCNNHAKWLKKIFTMVHPQSTLYNDTVSWPWYAWANLGIFKNLHFLTFVLPFYHTTASGNQVCAHCILLVPGYHLISFRHSAVQWVQS